MLAVSRLPLLAKFLFLRVSSLFMFDNKVIVMAFVYAWPRSRVYIKRNYLLTLARTLSLVRLH